MRVKVVHRIYFQARSSIDRVLLYIIDAISSCSICRHKAWRARPIEPTKPDAAYSNEVSCAPVRSDDLCNTRSTTYNKIYDADWPFCIIFSLRVSLSIGLLVPPADLPWCTVTHPLLASVFAAPLGEVTSPFHPGFIALFDVHLLFHLFWEPLWFIS